MGDLRHGNLSVLIGHQDDPLTPLAFHLNAFRAELGHQLPALAAGLSVILSSAEVRGATVHGFGARCW